MHGWLLVLHKPQGENLCGMDSGKSPGRADVAWGELHMEQHGKGVVAGRFQGKKEHAF